MPILGKEARVGIIPNTRQQIEQARLEPPSSLGDFLFPDKPGFYLYSLLGKINPRPLREEKLFLLRISPKLAPCPIRGVFLGKGEDWQKTRIETGEFGAEEIRKKLKKVGGVLIFIDWGQDRQIADVFTLLSEDLREEGKVWVLENLTPDRIGKLNEEERDLRLLSLESYGFVSRKAVSVRGEPFYLWYGRKEKERRKVVVDLTTWEWFERAKRRMVGKYEGAGWVVDPRNIIQRCQESEFPPEDYRNLRDGFGVKLTAPCGCEWEISLEGNQTRIVNCPEPDCPGIPPQIKKERKYFLVGFGIESGIYCGDCGQELLDNRVIEEKGRYSVKVGWYRRCPSCGLVSMKRIWVKKEEIKTFSPFK